MHSLKSRIIVSSMVVIFFVVLTFEIIFTIGIREYYYGSIERVIQDRATLSAEFYNKYLPESSLTYKSRYIIDNYGDDDYCIVQIINKYGEIVDSSNRFMNEKIVDSDDFKGALAGEVTKGIAKNEVTQEKLLSISFPLTYGYGQRAVIRYITSVEAVDEEIWNITIKVWFFGLFILWVALSISFVLAKSIIKPVKELILVSEKMAKGDFSERAFVEQRNEIGQLADTLNYLSDELSKMNRIKNEFISSISHEIRTPLTAIKGWSETLLFGGLDNTGDVKLGLEIISGETERLIGLTEELLDFSKLESNKLSIYISKVEVNKLLKEVSNQYRQRAKEKDIEIEVFLDDQIQTINGDRNRLKQVFINVLDNAIKFSKKDSTIKVSAKKIQGMVLISFADTGIGIQKEDLPKVKEKFFKGNNKASGSGIGLSVCNGIVELHGGKLEIESIYKQGTTVKIYLPVEGFMTNPNGIEGSKE